MDSEQQNYLIVRLLLKITLMGDKGSGTSSLCTCFSGGPFSETYTPTIGIDFTFQNFEVSGKQIKFQLWDTGGKESFREMRKSYIKTSNGLVIVLDLTNSESLAGLAELVKEAKTNASEGTPKVIVGTKADLAMERQVSFLDAQSFADEHSLKYFEASSKTGENVNNAFEYLAQQAIDAMGH